jgi:hypothetical protein
LLFRILFGIGKADLIPTRFCRVFDAAQDVKIKLTTWVA